MKIAAAICLLLMCTLSVLGQDSRDNKETAQYIVVPRDRVLMTVASQPDCPLRIEEAVLLMRVDKAGIIQRYKVRNVSSKPISFFTVVSYGATGAGGTLRNILYGSGRLLMPAESLDSMEGAG